MATLFSEIGASVDFTDPLDPVLQIPFSGIATGGQWNIPPDASTENLEPWMLSIIKTLALSTANSTSEESNITTNFGGKGFAVRDTSDKITYSYTIAFFLPDTTDPSADPDNF